MSSPSCHLGHLTGWLPGVSRHTSAMLPSPMRAVTPQTTTA